MSRATASRRRALEPERSGGRAAGPERGALFARSLALKLPPLRNLHLHGLLAQHATVKAICDFKARTSPASLALIRGGGGGGDCLFYKNHIRILVQ